MSEIQSSGVAGVVALDGRLDPVTVEVTLVEQPSVIEVGIIGPQGPAGPAGPVGATTLAALTDVDITNKVDNSVLYYNQTSSKFLADDINTIITITDGGNF